jgi:hypothetical protein
VAVARRLYVDLQSNNVRCWFAPEDLKIGDKMRTGIDEAIRVHDKLLLVLSKRSIESDWVEKEVETALEKERKQKRTVLFPIRLDDAVMRIDGGWPADIRRSRNIGDFRRWKTHDAYQKAFARRLRDLQAVDAPPISAPASVQSAPTISPASVRTHVQKKIATKTRRLQHLEQQQAFKGANTPAEVLMELEDLRRELAELEQQLAEGSGEKTEISK